MFCFWYYLFSGILSLQRTQNYCNRLSTSHTSSVSVHKKKQNIYHVEFIYIISFCCYVIGSHLWNFEVKESHLPCYFKDISAKDLVSKYVKGHVSNVLFTHGCD